MFKEKSIIIPNLFRVEQPGPHALLDNKPPLWTEEVDWEAHINGEKQICMVPIGRNDTCYWGALDIDAKGDAPPVAHQNLHIYIHTHNLPLWLFKSRSKKGAHAFLFSQQPIPAAEMVNLLELYAMMIKPMLHETHEIEIFPKQKELGGTNGSCIRLPFFGTKSEYFFDDYPKAITHFLLPPCLKELPEEGDRNNYVYHLSNFLIMSKFVGVQELLQAINEHFDEPLDPPEIEKTTNSARRHRNRTGATFGLGCRSCPPARKKHCRFANQLRTAETTEKVKVEIIHYIAEDPKIRMTVAGKSQVFSSEEAFDNHLVRLSFLMKHKISDVPLMGRAEWVKTLHELLETAEHIDLVSHRDRGHFILQQLKKWSKDFKNGMGYLYSGTPVFLSSDEVVLFSHDLYNRFIMTGVTGISRDEINNTLENIGTATVINGNPVIKIPVSVLGISAPGLEIPILNDINVDEVQVVASKDGNVIFKDKVGRQIELTNTFIKENPDLQRRILEATVTDIKVNF